MRRRSDNAVFEEVAWLEAEDANGFDADVVVGREVDDGGIEIVGDGAGENVGNAAAGVGDSKTLRKGSSTPNLSRISITFM